MGRKRLLVVGGTGYLGQHLLQEFSKIDGKPYDLALAFTYRSNPPQLLLDAIPPVLSFHVDLQIGEGFDSISKIFGQPDVVVNCAAISIPRACEKDPVAAMATNVPCSLVKWLSCFGNSNTLLIHLSTDQVYEGEKSFYKEEDETDPVNIYGMSKVAAEQFISANWSNFAILRSSIIYGPQTIAPVSKSLPIQWIDSVLSQDDEVEFFNDEFRTPIYVKDVVKIILALTERWISDGKQMQLLLNVGGRDRVSRLQMAEAVAAYRGYNTLLIKSVSGSSVTRGVASPADISMDISRLVQTLGITPVSFKDGVRLTLETGGSS
ncbi:NAD(P)-binding Rossmann-fold superfamily protein [Tasmannia lanceolata]|uniref:NAD(P)-binding Rossmann-fold superfamily protein n=1 Tax=Tasmannia lanceolata TaxID=3420 RepID=UPI004063A7E2